MPITESFDIFSKRYHRSSPNMGKSSTPRKWKAMHRPDWIHGEADEFFSSGKYHFAICKGTTPESMITSLSVGDKIVVRERTMLGKNNRQLKNVKNLQKLRYGTITATPELEENQKTGGGCRDLPGHCEEHELYYFRVAWEKESKLYYRDMLTNNPCKTFPLQN